MSYIAFIPHYLNQYCKDIVTNLSNKPVYNQYTIVDWNVIDVFAHGKYTVLFTIKVHLLSVFYIRFSNIRNKLMKGKAFRKQSLHGKTKQQPRFYWNCSSVEMKDATPLTHERNSIILVSFFTPLKQVSVVWLASI